ncbi:MAG TPA: outer membrane lipoprotein carrier protein LolA [Polyangia bacterium]|jgi:outer membrane lipoprotein carrier protein|nr:outer membrane lipoprotein carrier protein LolA [Polyangia bacterium]
MPSPFASAVLLVTLLRAAPPAPAPSPPAPAAPARLELRAVVDRVQKRYDGAGDFRARFSQTLTNPTFKRQTSSAGEVLLKKPGKMRWNYQTPEEKMYLADGAQLWLYEPEDKQAFKQKLESSQLPAALAFLTGKGKLSEEFDIAFASPPPPGLGKPRDYILSLRPRRAQPQVKEITFVVDPDSFLVRESVLLDGQGNINDMLFSDIKIGSGLPDSTFRWSPPAGTRVIDTAKLGK